MASEDSKIILGLPNLPADTIPKELWSEFLTVYRAIQNLLQGVSQYAGVDPPNPVEVAGMNTYDWLSLQNGTRFYGIAANTIFRGQTVRLRPDIGGGWVDSGNANSAAGLVIGVANETKSATQKIQIQLGGLIDSISGMAGGTLYYNSTTAGAIQNLRPVGAGQIIQPVGWSIDANHMWLMPSLYYQQL